MAKLIRKITNNFTVVHNQFIDDTDLFNESIGLLLKMLKLPDNWHFTVKGLTSICKDGERKITRQLHELENVGYLVRKCIKSKSGRIINWEYIISDEHLPEEIRILSFHYKQKRKKTEEDTQKPHLHFADMEDEDVQTVDAYKINNNKIKKEKIYPIRQSDNNCNLKQEIENDLQIQNDLTDRTDKAEQDEKTVPVGFDDEAFKEQIGYDRLLRDKPSYSAQVKAVVKIIGDMLGSKRNMRVCGQPVSRQKANERFSSLRYEHIEQVLERYNERLNKNKIPNDPSAYLLTMLYNAPHEYSLISAVKPNRHDDDSLHSFDISDIQGFMPYDNIPSFTIDDLKSLANNFD